MRPIVTLSLTILALAVAPSIATAENPTEGGYGPTPITLPPLSVAGASSSTPPATVTPPPADVTPPKTVQQGSLPFTGLDLGVISLLAAGLLGLGLWLRRATLSQDS